METQLSMDLVTKLSSWTDHRGDMDGPYHDTSVRCYTHITEPSDLCLRTNTVTDYYEANKLVSSTQAAALSRKLTLVHLPP